MSFLGLFISIYFEMLIKELSELTLKNVGTAWLLQDYTDIYNVTPHHLGDEL